MKSALIALALGVLIGGGVVLAWQRNGDRVANSSAAGRSRAAQEGGAAGARAPRGDVAINDLYVTAAASAGRGGAGGGGDNFWSTRFSAGNYNEDNSVGYVSVPGVGPVSYGM
jgi:hypothetical protein